MSVLDMLHGELIDIIEWQESSPDAMVWRFSRPRGEIKNGAQLIVRPGQAAVFVDQGVVADVFEPGRHELSTQNLPVLSRLRGWKFGFQSPFKADVIFVSTRQLPSQKWGTKTPLMTTDRELGPVRLRAYGTYLARVSDPAVFVTQLVGSSPTFETEQIAGQLRGLIVSRFSEALAEAPVSILALAARYSELAARGTTLLRPDLDGLGLELTQLVVESIALPDEVAATLDQRTRIGLLGDIRAYSELAAADAIRDSARNPGAGGAGAALGVGVALAGQLASATSAASRSAPATSPAARATIASHTPPPIPQARVFYLAIDGQQQGPFNAVELGQKAADGSLTRDTLVWADGMSDWIAAGRVPDVAARFTAP